MHAVVQVSLSCNYNELLDLRENMQFTTDKGIQYNN